MDRARLAPEVREVVHTPIAPPSPTDVRPRGARDRPLPRRFWAAYSEGGNSVKGEGFRTVRGFSKSLAGEAAYDEYFAYHQNDKYADDYVRAALWDRLADDSSAKADPRPALFDGTTLTDAMAKQIAMKGAVYQNTWIYALHELYSAIGKCESGNIADETGAPHAWDEGWAFYAGSLQTPAGSSGVLSYRLADKRCGNFQTCNSDEPAKTWRAANDEQNSNVNAKLLNLYHAGLEAVRSSTASEAMDESEYRRLDGHDASGTDCAAAADLTAEILAQMTVPLIQGTLRYAWRSDPNGGGQTFSSDGEVLAEYHAFAYAVLPRVAHCDAAAGEVLAASMAIPDELTEASAATVVPGGFAAVKAALESTYACLGITCADVGGPLIHDGAPVAGMEACDDGSTVNSRAEFFQNPGAADHGDEHEGEHEDGHDEHEGEEHDDHDGHDHGDVVAEEESDGAAAAGVAALAAALAGAAMFA